MCDIFMGILIHTPGFPKNINKLFLDSFGTL